MQSVAKILRKEFKEPSWLLNTFTARRGKIKVRKETKKGTYSIKVKVTSAATKNYNASTSAAKTIKVKVK